MSEKVSELQIEAFLECDRIKPCHTCPNDGVCCELVVSMARELQAYRRADTAQAADAETVRALIEALEDVDAQFAKYEKLDGVDVRYKGQSLYLDITKTRAALARLSAGKGGI